MHADKDDQLVVNSHDLAHEPRTGRILEVHGAEGGPPYLVRWDDSGRTALVFPGPDAHVNPTHVP